MRHSLLPLAFTPVLFLSLVACSSGSHPTSSTGPGAPAVQVDQANVPRDPAGSIDPTAVTAAANANNAFAFDLYSHVLAAQQTPGNLLTSPISASLALGMTYAGAQGQTATEMTTALHLGSASSTIFDGQNGLSAALAGRGASALAAAQQTYTEAQQENPGGQQQAAPAGSDYELEIVNSVWGEQTYPWAQPFLTTLAKSYGTGVYLEDFMNAWEPARQTINTWVAAQTDQKIEGLLPQGSLDDTTRMVLVNAVHLKMPWATPFPPSATANASFTRADGSSVSVPFMSQTQEYSYVDDGKAQIVAVPLEGGDVQVVFALPHGDLAAYEAGLQSLAVPAATSNIALSVPKFTFTSPTFSLAKALQAMGMVQAFDSASANFKGMCPQTPDGGNLYVSDVLQKAMISAQETGVEAAAATAVIIGDGSAEPPPPLALTLNRPFVVAIVDQPTGAILFLGHIADPSNAGGS